MTDPAACPSTNGFGTMTKSNYLFIILVAIASGFVSSLITICLFTPNGSVKKEIGRGNYQKTEGEDENCRNRLWYYSE
jgi:hypothetical protein